VRCIIISYGLFLHVAGAPSVVAIITSGVAGLVGILRGQSLQAVLLTGLRLRLFVMIPGRAPHSYCSRVGSRRSGGEL
jgi:hypothetical protein